MKAKLVVFGVLAVVLLFVGAAFAQKAPLYPQGIGCYLIGEGADLQKQSPVFIRGDVDENGTYTLGDGLFFLNYFFSGEPVPSCIEACDVDDGGTLTLGDGLYFLNYFFTGTPVIPPPSGTAPGGCGIDPTPDDLGCAEHTACGWPLR